MTDKQLLEKLVKGQEDIKAEQQIQSKMLNAQSQMLNEQGKTIQSIQTTQHTQGETLEKHGKALKQLTVLANKNYKSIEIMSGNFDEGIVNNEKRIDRIENHLNLPALKSSS